MNLPDLININGKKITMFEFMLTPCDTKENLHTWIELFLGLNMPDCIVCEESSASPMDMIWNVYRAIMKGDSEESSQLYFASRDSFKTLSAAVIEVLTMIHFRRTCSHMGAISQQADKCYDYFKRFLRKPHLNAIDKLKDTMKRTELDLQNEFDINPYLQIVICTMQGANSEHTNFMCVDEVDVVQNAQAYQEAKKIPTETPDKKPSITLYISTRKSTFGLVQREVDNASKSGLKVRSWNIIDVTQPCPPEKNLMSQENIIKYYKDKELELISPEEWESLPETKQSEYTQKTLYKGCLHCSIAALCLGRLATKQKSSSPLLKSHVDVEKKFRESSIDDAVAQLMCAKPSTHGLVFTSFDEQKSVKTPTQMWEIFMGQRAGREISKEELIQNFHERGIKFYGGIDWGWSENAPSVCLVVAIDKKHNIYVVHELGLSFTDDPEFISIIKKTIQNRFKIEMYYPDTAQPASINLLKKADLSVSSKVDKTIHLGIQTIKRYLKVPGLNHTKIFVLNSCKEFLKEVGKYHLKLDAAGQIVAHDEYEDEFNHYIDAFRYIIRNKLGNISPVMSTLETTLGDNSLRDNEGKYLKVPTAKELAEQLGIGQFEDNRDKIAKKDDDDDDKTGGDTGFTWSF